MSDLEELCETLTAVDCEIVSMARLLYLYAQRCNRAAQYAASAVRSEDGSTNQSALNAATALDAAAKSVSRAAMLLNASAQQGQQFVVRTVGGPGVVRAGGGVPQATVDAQTGLGSPRLQRIYDEESFAFSKGPGRFFLAQGDRFRSVAGTMPRPIDGSYLAMVHGGPQLVGVGSATLDARELADLIRNDPNYLAGQRVTLFACSTGQEPGGFAQRLADELGAAVIAPTSLAWLPPEKDGSILVTPMDTLTHVPIRDGADRGLGGWRQFDPLRR